MLAILYMGEGVTLTKTMPEKIAIEKPDWHPLFIDDVPNKKRYEIRFNFNRSGHIYEATVKYDQVLYDILKEYGWYHRRVLT